MKVLVKMQQVNIRCKQYCLDKTIIKLMKKYLKLDPKPSDLTMVRVIKARTGYRCKDIR